jgi:formylglycine-generating enzyme required for sulfatase activity
MTDRRASASAWCVVGAVVASAACAPPAATADMFAAFGFVGATATLRVEDAAGDEATFDVRLPDGSLRRAEGRATVGCTDNGDGGSSCTVAVVVDPGAYRFLLDVDGRDRCGASTTVVTLASGPEPIILDRFDERAVRLQVERADYDDDGDGIVNALEPLVCGRFDVADGALPPQVCATPDDPCCPGADGAGPSPLQGQVARFGGGPHERADGSFVDVAAFGLDATELTWGTFERCVAAGACLVGQSEHAVRVQLRDPLLDRRGPVLGLLPIEAEELCRWRGGRLPEDDEWDFAAAHRDDGSRGRYPFDDRDGALDGELACVEGSTPAANHAARGRACPFSPVPVGSYPSTFVQRGVGSPVADLAGNAAEWTVRRAVVPAPGAPVGDTVTVASDAVVPDDVVEVGLRGGGAGDIVELLENDVAVVVPVDALAPDRLRRLAPAAGVRCVVVPPAVVAVVDEPACRTEGE